MQFNLRSERSHGRGAVHAPHPDCIGPGRERRPLCPATTRWGHGFWWKPVVEEVTCRACLKLLGRPVPEQRRLSAKVALNKVLRDLGLRPGHDFSTHDHLMPLSQSGGFRCVQYTTVNIFGEQPIKTVVDNALAIVEALWTNKLGRHNFSVWVTKSPSGRTWVHIDNDEILNTYRAKDPDFRRIASWSELPDSGLYWGEEPADVPSETEDDVKRPVDWSALADQYFAQALAERDADIEGGI